MDESGPTSGRIVGWQSNETFLVYCESGIGSYSETTRTRAAAIHAAMGAMLRCRRDYLARAVSWRDTSRWAVGQNECEESNEWRIDLRSRVTGAHYVIATIMNRTKTELQSRIWSREVRDDTFLACITDLKGRLCHGARAAVFR